MRFFLIAIITWSFFTGFSQNDTIKRWQADSLKIKLKVDSARIFRFKKVRPYLAIDNRNSFIRKDPVNFKGIQLGVILYEKHIVSLGFYKMNQESQRPAKVKDKNIAANQYLALNYTTLFYSYALIDKRYFELDIPVEIGLGKYDIKLQDSITGKVYYDKSYGIVPIGAGLQVNLKPFRWIGLSLMGGYRYVLDNTTKLNFNGWYYSIGVWLDIRQTYRDIKFYRFVKKKYKKNLKSILNN